ncbi:hypothetical protein NPIL_130621 [Nephila pilipes]|uniref:Uncharacterized protein n=1 Tax=Nephila pilipes TaxID=299642 RepID=A0A8X6UNG9_NEPPI|nr:hypothetical protein NPIL_130621 [Nephila pilipes]
MGLMFCEIHTGVLPILLGTVATEDQQNLGLMKLSRQQSHFCFNKLWSPPVSAVKSVKPDLIYFVQVVPPVEANVFQPLSSFHHSCHEMGPQAVDHSYGQLLCDDSSGGYNLSIPLVSDYLPRPFQMPCLAGE